MRVKAMQTPDLFCKAKWSCTAADKWIDATEVFSPFPATANNVVPAIICCSTTWWIRPGLEKPQLRCPSESFPLPGCPVWLPSASPKASAPGQHLQPSDLGYLTVTASCEMFATYLPRQAPFNVSPQHNCSVWRIKTCACLVPCAFMGSVMSFLDSKRRANGGCEVRLSKLCSVIGWALKEKTGSWAR